MPGLWDNHTQLLQGVRSLGEKSSDAPPVAIRLSGVGGEGNDDYVYVTFAYDPQILLAFKSRVPQHLRRYDRDTREWCVRLDVQSILGLVDFSSDIDVSISEGAIARMVEVLEHHRVNRAESSALDSEAQLHIPGLKLELRPFQRAGVSYLVRNRRALLADQMGLGKSAQCIAAMIATGSIPFLVICPAALKYIWASEIAKWSDLSCQVINGSKPIRLDADVVIVNYDIISSHETAILSRGFRGLAVDEPHYIKSRKAARSRSVRTIASGIPTVYLLTGTPLLNRPVELINQLDTLGLLDRFGGYWGFVNRYCGGRPTRWAYGVSGATNLEELGERLRSICMVRRTTRDVLADLPPVQRVTLEVEIDNRAEYVAARRDVLAYAARLACEDKAFAASIAHLPEHEQKRQRIERAQDAAYRAARAETLVRIEKLKHLAAQGKLRAVREWIADYLQGTGPEDKLLVFADHRDIQQALADQIGTVGTVAITAEQSPQERMAAVEHFQSNPDVRIAVISLRAGGLGYTMTAARHVLFVEYGWRPADHEQAESRAYGRLNDPHPITAYYMSGARTIDEHMAKLLEEKRQVIGAALASGEPMLADHEGVLEELIDLMVAEEAALSRSAA